MLITIHTSNKVSDASFIICEKGTLFHYCDLVKNILKANTYVYIGSESILFTLAKIFYCPPIVSTNIICPGEGSIFIDNFYCNSHTGLHIRSIVGETEFASQIFLDSNRFHKLKVILTGLWRRVGYAIDR